MIKENKNFVTLRKGEEHPLFFWSLLSLILNRVKPSFIPETFTSSWFIIIPSWSSLSLSLIRRKLKKLCHQKLIERRKAKEEKESVSKWLNHSLIWTFIHVNLTGTRENEPFVFASNGFKHYRQAFHNIFFTLKFAQTNKTLFYKNLSQYFIRWHRWVHG